MFIIFRSSFFILLLPSLIGAAQIRGYVIDGASQEPLPVASIVVEGSGVGTTTNLDGYFVLPELKAGEQNLTVSYLGYETARISAIADGDGTRPIRIELTAKGLTLQDVTVTSKRSEVEDLRTTPRVSTVPVEGAVIKKISSLGGEMDVLRALQQVPGVKASSDLSSALHVRGGSPDQTLILMDHNVVYNPSHLFGLFSTFNADAVKRIDLIKGGFPAEYGGRSGSVLEVITNEGNRRETHGLASIGIVSARGAIEGPLPNGRGSYAASARRTYFDPVLKAARESGGLDLPGDYFYDANGKINFDLSDRTTLTLAAYAGDDIMRFELGPADDRFNFDLDWGNKTFSSRIRHALDRDVFISGALAYSRYRSHWAFADQNVTLDEGVDMMNDKSLKTDVEYYGLPGHRIKSGIWVSRYDIDFHEATEDIVIVDVDEATTNYSLYLQDNWRLSPFFELQPGLRAYYHEAGKHSALDPRLAAVWHYDPLFRIKGAVGRYTQFLNLITFGEGFSNFDLWVPIDESLKPSYSLQAVLGIEKDLDGGIELTAEGYWTDMRNLAAFDPKTDRAGDAVEAFVNGHGSAWGAEWMAMKKEGLWTGWVGYSLSWTKRRFPASLINYGMWFYPQWDRRHDIIVVAMRPLSRSWDFSASWRYNTGQGYTQALGIYTSRFADMDPSDWGNYGRTILPGSKNNYRFPSDHRLDLTFTWNHLFFKQNAKLNISIFNTYSRRPYWQRWFDTSENPAKITDLKLLPILPLVSYEVKF